MSRPVFHPVTADRWRDLTRLFGSRGACGGCWCMTPRLTQSEYERRKGESNRRALKRLVDTGREPGLLGYADDEPVAWVSVEPRESFGRLERSRLLAPVDDQPVWSIVCFFVHKDHRGRGLSVAAIRAAADHARANGAKIIEGYPVEPKAHPMPPVFAYTGLLAAYRSAGFREVARRSPTRPIVRLELD